MECQETRPERSACGKDDTHVGGAFSAKHTRLTVDSPHHRLFKATTRTQLLGECDSYGEHCFEVAGKEMLVWGNYCNVLGGAVPVNIL